LAILQSAKENENTMFSYIFMRILEARPHRYDWGINFLTLGQAGKIKKHVVTDFVRTGMDILDVGCGTGDLAVRAAKAGAFVTGVDISEGMLDVARERVKKSGLEKRVVLHHAGVTEIDGLFGGKCFDLITSTFVMSELYAEEREWALKHLLQVLKPDGKILLVSEATPKHFLKRVSYYALRFPLALATYLISQTGTKPVGNITDELIRAGFEVAAERRSFLGSIETVIAKRSEVTQPATVAETIMPDHDRSLIRSILDFCGRWFPNPVMPGLRRIGVPDRDSPVLVTGNFHLTVRRVEKSLKRQNCHLLVVQTKGINVWCASAGGEMNTHSILTALKTSDMARFVDHRELILPQLSAPGIDTRLLKQVSGWKGKWGPVYAIHLPDFLSRGHTKTQEQRRVRFDMLFRMEMLFSMNFLLWLFFTIIALTMDPAWAVVMTLIFWGAGFILYAGYYLLPFERGWSKALMLTIATMAVFILISVLRGGESWQHVGWMIFTSLVILSIGFDLKGIVGDQSSEAGALLNRMGFKSVGNLFRARYVHTGMITQDKSRCISCGICRSVCPVDVHGIGENQKDIVIVNNATCLNCSACVRQCPEKALFFRQFGGGER
jgi:ubiquinone/menaquinone biosynthesis C-methylase UbiE/NAD-dependent dihydropyrimidine dehydrogenase PreA subunit